MKALDGSYKTDLIEACTIPQISQPIRNINIDVSKYDHLKDKNLY